MNINVVKEAIQCLLKMKLKPLQGRKWDSTTTKFILGAGGTIPAKTNAKTDATGGGDWRVYKEVGHVILQVERKAKKP